MKKSLLGLAVLIAMPVQAIEVYNDGEQSLTVGGRMEGTIGYADGETKDKSRARLIIQGETAISNNLSAIAELEQEWNAEDSFFKKSYAGLVSGGHTLTYGKSNGSMNQMADFTDVMAYNGSSAVALLNTVGTVDNNVVYEYANYNTVIRMNTAITSDDEGGGASIRYDVSENTTVGLGAGTNGDTHQYLVGAHHVINGFYFAGLAGLKTGEVEYNSFEIVSTYAFGKTKLGISYEKGDYSDDYLDSVSDENKPTNVSNITVDARYFFKPNVTAYVSGVIDTTNEVGDQVYGGLKYEF